ncbi:MAG: hypothetical protein V9F82_00080 [Dermatophilaceae bacterium]
MSRLLGLVLVMLVALLSGDAAARPGGGQSFSKSSSSSSSSKSSSSSSSSKSSTSSGSGSSSKSGSSSRPARERQLVEVGLVDVVGERQLVEVGLVERDEHRHEHGDQHRLRFLRARQLVERGLLSGWRRAAAAATAVDGWVLLRPSS